MVHPVLLTLIRTPRLPVVDWTDVPLRFKWTRPFHRKTKSGFCVCAITFQMQCNHCCGYGTWGLSVWYERTEVPEKHYFLTMVDPNVLVGKFLPTNTAPHSKKSSKEKNRSLFSTLTGSGKSWINPHSKFNVLLTVHRDLSVQ